MAWAWLGLNRMLSRIRACESPVLIAVRREAATSVGKRDAKGAHALPDQQDDLTVRVTVFPKRLTRLWRDWQARIEETSEAGRARL